MSSLMALTGEYLELLDMAKDPDVDEQTLMDTMEAISGEISQKAGGCVAVIRHLEGRADTYEKEAERLSKAAQAYRNNVKRIKERIKYAMTQMDVTTIESDYCTIKIRKNGGVQPLRITGEVPDNYKKQKVTYEPDNAKIRDDLNAGVELSFAHLEERGSYLKID